MDGDRGRVAKMDSITDRIECANEALDYVAGCT